MLALATPVADAGFHLGLALGLVLTVLALAGRKSPLPTGWAVGGAVALAASWHDTGSPVGRLPLALALAAVAGACQWIASLLHARIEVSTADALTTLVGDQALVPDTTWLRPSAPPPPAVARAMAAVAQARGAAPVASVVTADPFAGGLATPWAPGPAHRPLERIEVRGDDSLLARRLPLVATALAVVAWTAAAVVLAGDPALRLPGWARFVLAVGVAAGGFASEQLEDRWGSALGPFGLLALAGGVYACVPDTEVPRLAFGVALGALACGWPLRPRAPLAGTGVAVTALLWAGATGVMGRPASIVGAVGSVGLLALTPAVLALVRTWPGRADVRATLTWAALAAATSLAASRMAGLWESPALAAGALALVMGAAAGALLVLVRRFAPSLAPPASVSARST